VFGRWQKSSVEDTLAEHCIASSNAIEAESCRRLLNGVAVGGVKIRSAQARVNSGSTGPAYFVSVLNTADLERVVIVVDLDHVPLA
jgi:hypothetical protein